MEIAHFQALAEIYKLHIKLQFCQSLREVKRLRAENRRLRAEQAGLPSMKNVTLDVPRHVDPHAPSIVQIILGRIFKRL